MPMAPLMSAPPGKPAAARPLTLGEPPPSPRPPPAPLRPPARRRASCPSRSWRRWPGGTAGSWTAATRRWAARRYSPPAAAREDAGHFERWLLGAFDNAVRRDLPSGGKSLRLLPPGDALPFEEVSALAEKHGWTLRLAVKEELAQGALGGSYDVPAAARGDGAAFGDWLLGAFNALPERGPSGGGTLHLLGEAMDAAAAQSLMGFTSMSNADFPLVHRFEGTAPEIEIDQGGIASLPEVRALGELAALYKRHPLRVKQVYNPHDLATIRVDAFEWDCAEQRASIRVCVLQWLWQVLQHVQAQGHILRVYRQGPFVAVLFRHSAWGGGGRMDLAGDMNHMEAIVGMTRTNPMEAVPTIAHALVANTDKLTTFTGWDPRGTLPEESHYRRAGSDLYPLHPLDLVEEVALLR